MMTFLQFYHEWFLKRKLAMIDVSDGGEVDHASMTTADQIFGDECVD